MILGNAGVVTVIVTATSSMVVSKGMELPITILVLIAGLYIIYKIVTRQRLVRRWETFIEDKLIKSGTFEEGTTEDLLHLLEGHVLLRVIIKENSSLAGTTLQDSHLKERGIISPWHRERGAMEEHPRRQRGSARGRQDRGLRLA